METSGDSSAVSQAGGEDSRINWGNINRGFDGFEQLAVDYVNDVEKPDKTTCWKRTGKTRDGNKDAYAIVVGYRRGGIHDLQWWMEAKYSTRRSRLTRYRLDPTIVSAFIQQDVERIIFVTNIDIASKTICDIQAALRKSPVCSSAVFYAKSHLEHWLLEDYERYSRYFDDLDRSEFNQIDRPPFWMRSGGKTSAELFVYPASGIMKEPVDTIFSGERYVVPLEIESTIDQHISLTLETNELSVGPIGKRRRKTYRVHLNPGVQSVNVPISLVEAPKRDGATLVIAHEDKKQGNKRVVLCTARALIFQAEAQLDIASQNETFQAFQALWHGLKARTSFSVLVITGDSGTGKTYVLRKIRNRAFDEGASIHEASFVDDEFQNIRLIRNMIFGFLFPFVNPQDIDEDYLSDIDGLTKRQMKRLAALASIGDDENGEWENNILDEDFFRDMIPEVQQRNRQILICDDVQKLSNGLQHALFQFICVLKERRYSGLVIIAGQNSSSWTGLDYLRARVHLQESCCYISYRDIERYIDKLGLALDEQTANKLFGSVVEFAFFLTFLQDTGQYPVRSLSDFKTAYHLFRGSDMLEEYLRKKFDDASPSISNGGADTWDVLSFIYYCPRFFNRFEYPPRYDSSLQFLLSKKLIRYNANGEIAPFHDIYADFFRRTYKLSLSEEFHLRRRTPLVDAMIDLSTSQGVIGKKTYNYLSNLYDRQTYRTLFLLLNPYFESHEQRQNIRTRVDQESYAKLFWLYSYANANSGQRSSGLKLFEELKGAVDASASLEMTTLHFLATFEALNSSYEHMDYQRARQHLNDMRTDACRLESHLSHLGTFEKVVSEKRWQAQSIEIMLDAEQDKDVWEDIEGYIRKLDKQGLFPEHAFDVFRVTLTQLTSHYEEALDIVERCKSQCSPDNRKGTQMASFADEYFKCVANSSRDLSALERIHRDIRVDFYNDYNRHLPSMAIMYLIRGDSASANACLYEYHSTQRSRSIRQDAICAVAEALVYMKEKTPNAKNRQSEPVERLEFALHCLVSNSSYATVLNHNIAQCKEFPGDSFHVELYHGQDLQAEHLYFDARFIY